MTKIVSQLQKTSKFKGFLDKNISSEIINDCGVIFICSLEGNVLFWNLNAEKLFGYKSIDILGSQLPFITQHSEFELEHIINEVSNNKKIVFRTQKSSVDGNILDLVMSVFPVKSESKITGFCVFVNEYSDIKSVCYIPLLDNSIIREQKRTFIQLRNIIIATLSSSKKTINQIANDSGINWKTVEKHLTHLIGKKLVDEVFSSEYVRIFELTNIGRTHLELLRFEEEKKYITRI